MMFRGDRPPAGLRPTGRSEGRATSEPPVDPLTVLIAIAEQRSKLDTAERAMINRARQRGVTFEQIGKALGVTRQAVHAKMRKAGGGSLVVGVLVGYDDLTDAVLSLLA